MTDQTDAPDETPQASPRRSLFWPITIGVILVSCIAAPIIRSARGQSEPSTGYDAQFACEGFIKDRLKAPSTAQFSGETFTGSAPRWTVTGAVDAQNSFGAALRNSWSCIVRIDGDTWHLEELTGLE